MQFKLPPLSNNQLIISTAIFFMLVANQTFFNHVLTIYPLNLKNIGFLITLFFGFTSAIILVLSLFGTRYTLKPLIISLLLISAFTSYFMDSYNTVIDTSMIENIIHTNVHESLDLLSFSLILYVIFLGILPALLVYKLPIHFQSGIRGLWSKLKLIMIILVLVFSSIFMYSDFFSSFWREHKSLRYYANPSFYLYSSGKYISSLFKSQSLPLQPIGLDAHILNTDTPNNTFAKRTKSVF